MKYFRNLALCFSGRGYSGQASGRGFQIQKSYPLYSYLWVTRGHSATLVPRITMRALLLIILLTAITAVLLDLFAQRIFGFPENVDDYSLQYLPLVGYFLLLSAIRQFLHMPRIRAGLIAREGREVFAYHATEHKVIVCVSHRLPPTLKTLKRVPKTIVTCGSAGMVRDSEFLFFLGLIFLLTTISNPVLNVGMLVFWVFFVTSQTIVRLGLIGWLRASFWPFHVLAWGLLIFILPLSITSLLIEKFLFLREPSDEILQEGVELAQQIYEDLGIVPEPES